MKKLILSLFIGLGLLTLFLFSKLNTSVDATTPQWSQCKSTGFQCGTDNGTQYKTAEPIGVCPTNYHYQNNGNWNERCHRNDKWTNPNCYDWTPFPGHYECSEHTTPTGISCPESYVKAGENENTTCTKTQPCHTGVIQYDSCEQEGQCPTSCGLEASEVPDGKGGYLKCDATDPCPPAEGLCPTECGKFADYVPDGRGGEKFCPATPNCGGGGETPRCTSGVPAVVPANVHVVRNGSDATVNAHIPEGDRVNIYFKEVDATDWQHSARDIVVTGKYLSYTIHDLNPALGYTFGVQSANGCAGGEIILSVVVDPPSNGRTFMFSHFEWLK